MVQFAFDTAGVDTSNTFDALPNGEYTVIVSESDMRTTQRGNGSFIALTLEVQAPEQFRGRKLWDNLNVDNPNPKAVEIAQRQMAQLIKACGLEGISSTEQLHNIPVTAVVRVQKDDATRNEVKGYKVMEGAANQAPAQQPQMAAAPQAAAPVPQQAPPQAQAAATPPWMQ